MGIVVVVEIVVAVGTVVAEENRWAGARAAADMERVDMKGLLVVMKTSTVVDTVG